MSNVVQLPGVFEADRIQVIQDFDRSDFCALLEADICNDVHHINGMTILNFPKVVLVCNGESCTSIAAAGVSVAHLVDRAHQLIDGSVAA